MVEKILNNTTTYEKIRASHEGSLHSSTLNVCFVCRLLEISFQDYTTVKRLCGKLMMLAHETVYVTRFIRHQGPVA